MLWVRHSRCSQQAPKWKKVQGVLVQILSNCSKLGTFKETPNAFQTQLGDANGPPSSQNDELFLSDPSFQDA